MFNLFGIEIHFYGLLIGVGIWLGFEIALRGKKNRDKQIMEGVLPWILFGGIIGARVYHVIDLWQKYYSLNPVKIFFVWEGGLGIWGAIIGGILAVGIYSRVKKVNFLAVLDNLIVGVPVAQAIGRLGNWANGELVGKNGEPLFIYEAGLNIILYILLTYLSGLPHPPKRVRNDGRVTGLYLIGYGVIRIILEGFRPSEIIWRIGGIPTAVIFGSISIVIGLFMVCHSRPDRESI